MNKAETYPKENRLLETETFRKLDDLTEEETAELDALVERLTGKKKMLYLHFDIQKHSPDEVTPPRPDFCIFERNFLSQMKIFYGIIKQ